MIDRETALSGWSALTKLHVLRLNLLHHLYFPLIERLDLFDRLLRLRRREVHVDRDGCRQWASTTNVYGHGIFVYVDSTKVVDRDSVCIACSSELQAAVF